MYNAYWKEQRVTVTIDDIPVPRQGGSGQTCTSGQIYQTDWGSGRTNQLVVQTPQLIMTVHAMIRLWASIWEPGICAKTHTLFWRPAIGNGMSFSYTFASTR